MPLPALILLGVTGTCGVAALLGPRQDGSGVLSSFVVIGLGILVIGWRLGFLSIANGHLWALVFVLLLGTLPKLTLLAYATASPSSLQRDFPELRFATLADLQSAYVSTATAIMFVAIAFLAIPLAPKTHGIPPPPTLTNARGLLIGTILASVVSSVAQYVFGLGVLGQGASELPLGLGTLITRTRGDFVPALAILVLYYAIRGGRDERWALGLIASHAVVGAFLTTSRGTVFEAALAVLALYAFSGKLRGRIIGWVLVMCFAGLALYPIITQSRAAALGESSNAGASWQIEVVSSGSRILSRIQGADGLLHISALGDSSSVLAARLGDKVGPAGLAEYYTKDIVGVPRENDFRSPGLLAGLALLVGQSSVPFVLLLGVPLFHLLGRYTTSLGPQAVSTALLFVYVFATFSEGTYNPRELAAFAIAVSGTAWLHKRICKKAPALKPSS